MMLMPALLAFDIVGDVCKVRGKVLVLELRPDVAKCRVILPLNY